jgi:microcystin-dependent protein
MSQPFLGEIKIVGFNFNPRGYAYCSGQILAISQNSALFALLGTTYGGNGTTTFGLPNLQSRVPVGQGQGAGLSPYVLGQMGATENTTLLISNMPAHNHTLTGSVTVTTNVNTVSAVGDQAKPGGHLLAKGQDATTTAIMNNYSDAATDSILGGVGSSVTNTLQVGVTGSGIPFSHLSPYLALNFIIATSGIFPTRS